MTEQQLSSIESIANDSRYDIMPSVRQHLLDLVEEVRRLKGPVDTCTGFYTNSGSIFTCSFCNRSKEDHYNGKIEIVDKQWLKDQVIKD